MSPSPKASKKTIYIDVDEEITGIIDKVRSAQESIIALVLPKRAPVLQSIVNMKLLKRASTQNDKKVVLITSESSLLPLAGAAGLHVAANLQSRPYLPAAPGAQKPAVAAEEPEPEINKSEPIGNFIPPTGDPEPIEIDNRPPQTDTPAAATAAAAKAKKDKNKKVPNFQKFRLLLIGGAALLLLLIGFGYWALAVAPKATITLRTESSQTDARAEFIADAAQAEADLENGILPARQEELKKNETEKVPATGEEDKGAKASGQVKFRNCVDEELTVPAGTRVTNGEFTFLTTSKVELNDDKRENGECIDSPTSTKTVKVVAEKNGDQYNLSPRTYIVSGFEGIVAEGRQMSGGSSKVVKVVTAQDIEAAKQRVTDKQNAAVEEVKRSLERRGFVGLVDSFQADTAAVQVTPAVGTEATEVTASGEVTYRMLGLKEEDIQNIIKEQIKDEVDISKQSILDYGLDEASYELSPGTNNSTNIALRTSLLVGPELDQGAIKEELAGKKRGEGESMLKQRPGVTEARIETSPFWVSKVPGNESKVTINVEQADGTPITD